MSGSSGLMRMHETEQVERTFRQHLGIELIVIDAEQRFLEALAGIGYKGYYSFEWEKRWHPEIEDPEVAFPHFAETMRRYLGEAGASR